MPQTYHQWAAQARELTNEDRVRLAQSLLSSLSLARSHEDNMRELKKIPEGRIGFSESGESH
jgi:hypothetical protein